MFFPHSFAFRFVITCIALTVGAIGDVASLIHADEQKLALPVRVPSGFSVVKVAGAPVVQRPMFVTQAADGTLFVLDSGGVNGNDRGTKPPDVIRRLEDRDGDGVYEKSSVFADKIVFGTGLVWYDNALFVTSPPSLWKLEDTDRDGSADKRTELVTGFAFNQSCSDDVHGACLGPDGRIYFLPGRFPHKVQTPGGKVLRAAYGPWLMRCRPDGRDVEFVSGAVGNPVEVAFLPTGDAFVQGTFWAKPSAPDGLRDAVIHAVEGGEYSVRDRDYNDRIRTGDFLPALVPLSATAPSGLTTYRGVNWGEDYRDNLYTSHFNTGKILRHKLKSDGATYTAETTDFVTGAHGDIHFTDAMQCGDGSLLVVDTGGWFHACCPASGSAKPDLFGAIYRVTKEGSPPLKDAYGNGLEWSDVSPGKLVERLDDARFTVRERATEALRKLGAPAIVALRAVLDNAKSPAERRLGAVWALCRIEDESARAAERIALADQVPAVREVAVRAAALHRDTAATDSLIQILKTDSSVAVRREAANALGRSGRAETVPALLEALAITNISGDKAGKPFFEHSIILALIRINAPVPTRAGLQAENSAVRRASLIALDQMPAGMLAPQEVTTLLKSEDAELQQAAIAVIGRHQNWVNESVQFIDGLLDQRQLDEGQQKLILGSVRALRAEPALRKMLDRRLQDGEKNSPLVRLVLLEAVANTGTTNVSQAWQNGIQRELRAEEESIGLAALNAVANMKLKKLADPVRQIAADKQAAPARRLAALRALAALPQPLSNDEFDFLLTRLSQEVAMKERLVALGVVATGKWQPDQLQRLIPLFAEAGPVELPYLLAAFSTSEDVEVGRKLVESLSAATVSLSPELLRQTLERYPASVKDAAAPLQSRLQKTAAQQQQRLDELERVVQDNAGDSGRGQELFFGKANCHLCHTAESRGGKVGPQLTGIGAIRTRRDLLEAIAFPSATYARGYEPVVAVLKDGRVLNGMMGRETPEDIVVIIVQDHKPVETPLRRADIEELQIGRVSIMPQGLDSQLKPQELSDLISYLRQLRK